MRTIAVIAISVLFVGCSSIRYKAQKSFNEGGFEFAILNSTKYNSVSGKAKPLDLSSADVSQIKLLLILARNEYNHTIQDSIRMIRPFENYRLQWVPFINEKGEKEVWVSGLCKRSLDSDIMKQWKKKLIVVRDGGNCYFHLRVNLTLESYTNVSVNGRA
jgi:hypothetical protein